MKSLELGGLVTASMRTGPFECRVIGGFAKLSQRPKGIDGNIDVLLSCYRQAQVKPHGEPGSPNLRLESRREYLSGLRWPMGPVAHVERRHKPRKSKKSNT